MITACLDEKTVLAFLAGSLSDSARDGVDAHLGSCSDCAEIVTWAAADIANASRNAGREGRPFLGQLAPGARVDRYQILGPVGRGGMGEVYAAYHPDLDRRIALKIVYGSSAGSAERRARLLREARTIARLSHPNVIPVYDAGTFGEHVYIAMEFVDGDTLDDWLRATLRSWSEILDVFVATGRGLAAAHAAGIVHRDFKPQNLMIGKDRSVRVMDFGLARVTGRDLDTSAFAPEMRDAAASSGRAPVSTRVTKTGALFGTPAYMSPEQWRGEPLDARADQFSFCVALHESLYGTRPPLSHLRQDPEATKPAGSGARRRASAPGWLRAAVLRGLATDRQKRFDSMDQLIGALTRGRTRVRRRFSVIAVGVAVTLLGAAAWRLSQPRHFDCKPPFDRLAAAWNPGDPSDTRHQSIRAAVLASGHREAATIWSDLSAALDAHVTEWTTMYKEACEATHLRGEQSEDVLDLRMRCLNENLDEVRALTDALGTADRATVPQALTAVSELTPIARCKDIRVLRAAVPLPRDEKTLRAVQALQQSIKEIDALLDVGRFRNALAQATDLRPRVEVTRYKPLLAELLAVTGLIQAQLEQSAEAQTNLKESFAIAITTGDDLAAAQSASSLVYVTGFLEDRFDESTIWWSLANSLLDRLGDGHDRLRAWLMHNRGVALARKGDPLQARDLLKQAVVLKQRALGRDHPDVAISLNALAQVLQQLGEFQEALNADDRAATMLPRNSGVLDDVFNNRGEVLIDLGRYAEAERSLASALTGLEADGGSSRLVAYPLTALGEVKLATGNPSAALSYFERALRIREKEESDPALVAETRFGLARALWESGGDRERALSLTRSAGKSYGPRARHPGEIDASLSRRGPVSGALGRLHP